MSGSCGETTIEIEAVSNLTQSGASANVARLFLAPLSMSNTPLPEGPAGFEAALAELERIVASMEAGQLTLEQSLTAHKRGLELARYCQTTLAQAQQQVRVLEGETLKALSGDESES